MLIRLINSESFHDFEDTTIQTLGFVGTVAGMQRVTIEIHNYEGRGSFIMHVLKKHVHGRCVMLPFPVFDEVSV